MKEKDVCRVPVRGTYTVNRKTGEITEKRLDYADIPAEPWRGSSWNASE